MKQIIPFKKELLFKTKISEITSISLENTLSLKENDLVSGEFHISGDYKMTEASINREKFYFTLPFEITLDSDYDPNTINIDIYNFYYEVINDDSLQVNIDVYVDGEKMETKKEENQELIDSQVEIEKTIIDEIPEIKEVEKIKETENLDRSVEEIIMKEKPSLENIPSNNSLQEERKKDKISDIKNMDNLNIAESGDDSLNQIINYKEDPIIKLEKEEKVNNINIDSKQNNINNNFNLFDSDIFNTDTYVTYYVYLVKEEDNIDKIMEKFSVTKDELENYNDLSNIKAGTKLIIPSKNE